jgi:hypothetical protein
MVRIPTAAALACVLATFAASALAAPPAEPHPLPVPDEALWADTTNHAVVPRCGCGGRRRNQVDLTIPIWVPGVTGSFASGSTSVDADRPEGDGFLKAPEIATSVEFAFMGRVDARFDRWILYADAFGVKLDETLDARVNSLDAEGEIDAWVGRLLGGYRVVDHRSLGGCTRIDVDALAGARFCYAEISLDEPEALAFSKDDFWVDPLVGARVRVDLPGPVDLQVLGDVGGFDVGSELSWALTVEATWRVSRRISILLGYSWLSVEYDVGSDDDRFVLDLDVRGPQLGITFHL